MARPSKTEVKTDIPHCCGVGFEPTLFTEVTVFSSVGLVMTAANGIEQEASAVTGPKPFLCAKEK
jgi:hypothetical protein